MALAAGTQLGPYEIVAPLGAGGMGEVYRARDTRLDRTVAIKILNSTVTATPDGRARFQREARSISQLEHPHICTLHDVGSKDRTDFLVMEFLEGETLANRLRKGALPLDQVLKIGIEISDALDKAHRTGIVHRDLKPGNVMLTKNGAKLLDFGLAKPNAMAASVGSAPLVSAAVTVASPRPSPITTTGTMVGTLQYMSPEQIEGKDADLRSDIFAFGAMLYEMAVGHPAFQGKSQLSIASAILEKDPPPLSSVQPHSPPLLDHVIRTCLAKNPDERFQSAADVRLQLKWLQAYRETTAHIPHVRIGALIVFAVAVVLLGLVAIRTWRPATTVSSPPLHIAIHLPDDSQLALGITTPLEGIDGPVLSLSADGRYLAYIGQSPSGTMVYLRHMNALNVTPVAGTEGAIYPFFSPDSRWLGFLTNDQIKKVPTSGGTPVALSDVVAPVRATWLPNGAIYIAEDEGRAISRVPASGGAAVRVANSGTVPGVFSQTLPDGKWALMSTRPSGINGDYRDIVLASLTGGGRKVLLHSGYDARYVPPGYLLFGRGGNLFALRFDKDREEVIGEPELLVSGVSTESLLGQVQAAASENGLLAYVPGADQSVGRLAWVDRDGRTEQQPGAPRVYGTVALSLNGKRLAVQVGDATDYIWIYDLLRGEGRSLPFKGNAGWPAWKFDNATIAFLAFDAYAPNQGQPHMRIMVRQADGGGIARQVGPEFNDRLGISNGWSPDGRILVVDTFEGVKFLNADDGTVVASSVNHGWGRTFSPDGRWIAYTSTEGRSEILVTSYPDGKITRQFSTEGGIEPLWCACGELFYRYGNRWFSAKVQTEPELKWEPPRQVFQTDFVDTPGLSYAVSPDGKRLLVVKAATPGVRSRIHLVTNWTEMLKSH